VGVTRSMVDDAKSDGATASITTMIELARNQAASERREFQIIFSTPNKIEVLRQEVPTGSTSIATRYLENGLEFLKLTTTDTPDGFGNTTAIHFGSSPTIRFTSDGSLLDSSGDVINGSVFVGLPGKVSSARAVTIFGATGLIRPWKWNGTAWIE
jgi:hypothetical protein